MNTENPFKNDITKMIILKTANGKFTHENELYSFNNTWINQGVIKIIFIYHFLYL